MAKDIEFGMKACTKFEPLLEDYLDGELSVGDAKFAEQHWQSCAGCRGALEQAASSVRLLRHAGSSEGPGPAFVRTVIARIRTAEHDRYVERAGFWQPLVSLGWRFAATATIVLGVLVTYDAGWGRHPQPNVTTARLMDVSDFFGPDPANPPATTDEVLMMAAETNHAK
jgi:putative zinc finger protein